MTTKMSSLKQYNVAKSADGVAKMQLEYQAMTKHTKINQAGAGCSSNMLSSSGKATAIRSKICKSCQKALA